MAAYTSLQRSGSPIWGVAFNPLCPSIFAAGGRDGCAYIWSSGVGEPQRVCCGHAGEVTCLAWHGNGVYLLTGSSDGCVRVWEASSGDCVRVLLGVQRGGGSGVTALAVAPGGRHLASGDESGAVTLWDLPLGECVQCWAPPTPHSPLHALSFTRDGRGVVAGSSSSSGSSGSSSGSGSIGVAPVQHTVSSAIERAAPELAPAPAPEPVSDLDHLFAALTRGGLFGGGDDGENDARSTGREE